LKFLAQVCIDSFNLKKALKQALSACLSAR